MGKQEEINHIFHTMCRKIGMDLPNNHHIIEQYIFEDVDECADPIEWSDGDVAIAFRRWIETQA